MKIRQIPMNAKSPHRLHGKIQEVVFQMPRQMEHWDWDGQWRTLTGPARWQD
jgi:hypothetical protein